jgi:hypothetical protein
MGHLMEASHVFRHSTHNELWRRFASHRFTRVGSSSRTVLLDFLHKIGFSSNGLDMRRKEN